MHFSNFKLSKEAQDYAELLIKEAEKMKEYYGGVISKSNIKLDDNGDEIKEDVE